MKRELTDMELVIQPAPSRLPIPSFRSGPNRPTSQDIQLLVVDLLHVPPLDHRVPNLLPKRLQVPYITEVKETHVVTRPDVHEGDVRRDYGDALGRGERGQVDDVDAVHELVGEAGVNESRRVEFVGTEIV